MPQKASKENLRTHQCYMPCPCLKRENGDEVLCINGNEVHDVTFVDFGFIPTCVCTDKDANNSLCLNMVFVDKEGFIRCGTSKRPIKIRNYSISATLYLEAVKKVKELYNGNLVKVNSCPECLYKNLANKLNFQKEQNKGTKDYANAVSHG